MTAQRSYLGTTAHMYYRLATRAKRKTIWRLRHEKNILKCKEIAAFWKWFADTVKRATENPPGPGAAPREER